MLQTELQSQHSPIYLWVARSDGVLWGHTLNQLIGHWGMYVGTILMLVGIVLIVLGWREIYRRYWSKTAGQGQLVVNGIYRVIQHPQYTGFMLITLGMLMHPARAASTPPVPRGQQAEA